MTLNISRKLIVTKAERQKFVDWAEGFYLRAEDEEDGERNLRRAMRSKYGHPDYWITGYDDLFQINIGEFTD